jgi:transcription initiation factor TFIIB
MYADQYTLHDDESNGRTVPADSCPDCDGALRTDGGETRCQQCGLRIEACRIDHRGSQAVDTTTGRPVQTHSPQ